MEPTDTSGAFKRPCHVKEKVMAHVSPEMRRCIEECQSCQRICVETVTHCLQKGGRHAEAEHVRLLLDCAEICQTSANFMLRGSELHSRACAVCAEVCDRCAESCERSADGDEMMTRCAEACRRCAESCRQMAGRAGGVTQAAA